MIIAAFFLSISTSSRKNNLAANERELTQIHPNAQTPSCGLTAGSIVMFTYVIPGPRDQVAG